MSASPPESWIGQVLAQGRYRIEARLGKGGMGLVYLAVDVHQGLPVVIKVPLRAVQEDPNFAGRFTREIRALARFDHPHIVKMLDAGEHQGHPFAVLQYLAGGSLRDRQGKPPGSLRAWLPQIGEALDHLHRHHSLHRDVKPENILFDAEHKVYLSDFGIVKALYDDRPKDKRTVLTGTGMVLGTPQYMAPEVLLDRPCDGRVDQYALAVTVFECLLGRVPFDGTTPAAIILQQASRSSSQLERYYAALPEKLAGALRRALDPNPEMRFPTCKGFAGIVLANLIGASVSVPTPPPPGTKPAPAKKTDPVGMVCPSCRKKLMVSAAPPGKPRFCPACGQQLQERNPPPATDRQRTSPATGTNLPSPGRGSRKLRLVHLVLFVLVVAGAAGLIYGLATWNMGDSKKIEPEPIAEIDILPVPGPTPEVPTPAFPTPAVPVPRPSPPLVEEKEPEPIPEPPPMRPEPPTPAPIEKKKEMHSGFNIIGETFMLEEKKEKYSGFRIGDMIYQPYQQVDRHALETPKEEEGSIDRLTAYLTRHQKDDEYKARAIYRWITDRIVFDDALFRPGTLQFDLATYKEDNSPQGLLRRRKGICEGYARLFAAMCEGAGIEARIIAGDLRRSDMAFPHAWNAVRLNGQWALVDSTLGASIFSGKHRKFIPLFNGFYFRTPPESLIFTHYPFDSKWQLLADRVSRDQFLTFSSKVPFALLHHGFDVSLLRRMAVDGEEFPMTFATPKPVLITKAPLRKTLKAGQKVDFVFFSSDCAEIRIEHGGMNDFAEKGRHIFYLDNVVVRRGGRMIVWCRFPGLDDPPLYELLIYDVESP